MHVPEYKNEFSGAPAAEQMFCGGRVCGYGIIDTVDTGKWSIFIVDAGHVSLAAYSMNLRK